MTKFKVYFDKMLSENRELFNNFTSIHFEYSIDPDANQEKFNKIGEHVLDVVREWDNRLCNNTERGMYNKFSTGLSEKFWEEIRKHYPLIDHVGVKVGSSKPATDGGFVIKKINMG